MSDARIIRLGQALAALPRPATEKWPDGTWYDTVLDQPGLQILVFAPKGTDYQTPHRRDETYIVVGGHGTLEVEGEVHRLAAGDLAFIPNGAVHRFTDFSDDFVAWVLFVS